MKCIAFASSDGARVDRHFGRADQFHLYKRADGLWSSDRVLYVEPLCGEYGHTADALGAIILALDEADLVVAVQAGDWVIEALAEKGKSFAACEAEIVEVLKAVPDPASGS